MKAHAVLLTPLHVAIFAGKGSEPATTDERTPSAACDAPPEGVCMKSVLWDEVLTELQDVSIMTQGPASLDHGDKLLADSCHHHGLTLQFSASGCALTNHAVHSQRALTVGE